MATLLVAGLLTAGCGLPGGDDPEPQPSRPVAGDTVSRSTLGAELVVTAAVARLITVDTFVVRDVDLPGAGLLVLGATPAELGRRDLVTIRGRVELFDFGRHALRYRLAPAGSYAGFTRVLVADEVRRWA